MTRPIKMYVVPVRLQRSRKKGSRLVSPNGLPVVCVTRGTKYGNPYKPGRDGTATECKEQYANLIAMNIWTEPNKRQIKRDLRGKNLACWCPLPEPGQPDLCHAAILLVIANQKESM